MLGQGKEGWRNREGMIKEFWFGIKATYFPLIMTAKKADNISKAVNIMTLWDKFFESSGIRSYLIYAAHRKEDTDNADLYGTDTEGK